MRTTSGRAAGTLAQAVESYLVDRENVDGRGLWSSDGFCNNFKSNK